MAGVIVQSVASSVNGATGVTVNIASTTAGNLLLLAQVMTNNTSTLSTAFTGTNQTVTSIEHPTGAPNGIDGAGAQAQMWYVPNCASGTTAVTFSRNTGTGQFSAIVVEVSGEATSTPLDQHTSSGSQTLAAGANAGITTGTTGTTTSANEFWYAIFPEKAGDTAHNAAPTFSALSAGWTQDQTSGSTAASGSSNVSIMGAWQTVTSTGAANATDTVTIAAGASATTDGMGIVATFLDAGGVVGIPPGLGPVVSMQEPALTADLSAMMR